MDKERLRIVIKIIALGGVSILVYTFFHELGHTIVALFCGAQITEFDLINAHMSYINGSFTRNAELLFHSMGALLPYLLALIHTFTYSRKIKSRNYKILSLFISVITNMSLLSWIVIPILYNIGEAPLGDDVTKALDVFCRNGSSPFLLMACAIVLFIFGLSCAVLKGIPQNFFKTIADLRSEVTKNAAV